MAFFPRALYDESHSFTPLCRLLNDFDNYTRQGTSAKHSHDNKRSGGAFWQPQFDARETEDNYELYGELPGLNKENVHIEFAEEAQTLIVRGRSERSYSSGTPPAGALEQSNNKGTITDGGENADQGNAQKKGETAMQKSDEKDADHSVKYWLSERSVGEFSRTFTFPSPVDRDAVSASFKDGILSIVVPKAKKQSSRRIAIN